MLPKQLGEIQKFEVTTQLTLDNKSRDLNKWIDRDDKLLFPTKDLFTAIQIHKMIEVFKTN